MLKSGIAALLLTTALACSPADAAQKIVRFAYNADIQVNLIKQFPTGVFTPANSFPVTFTIPKAKLTATPPKYNFWADTSPLVAKTAVLKPIAVYLLAASYHPTAGAVIATVTLTGARGATYVQSLVGGTDIRDFCQNVYANTINGTTTQNAYEIDNVQGACGTGNVSTGLVANYRLDEVQITVPTTFTQKLVSITITPGSGQEPVIAGITVAY